MVSFCSDYIYILYTNTQYFKTAFEAEYVIFVRPDTPTRLEEHAEVRASKYSCRCHILVSQLTKLAEPTQPANRVCDSQQAPKNTE